MSGEQEEKTMTQRIRGGCYSLPWCNILLVSMAITAHTLVFMGNLATANTFSTLGAATGGWGNVGLSMSSSMVIEIEDAMAKTTDVLTDALRMAVDLEADLDVLFGSTGNSTQEAIATYHKARSIHALANAADDTTSLLATGQVPTQADLRKQVTAAVAHMVENAKKGMRKFFQLIKPALLQVGRWLKSMGAKIQGFIEQFSQTIDKVQKIFDQVMAKVASGAPDGLHDQILFDTFAIFDISDTGAVTANDIQEVSNLYGITALNGKKGTEMLKKYDKDNNGQLDEDEYSEFVLDPDLPQVMPYVLRIFAKKLTSVSGTLKGAKTRDEVAESLGNYLTLMVAKNITKVRWISETLTNQSLPIQLTIDVFKTLVDQENKPDRTVNFSTGLMITQQMLQVNAPQVSYILKRMADADLWASQGWDPLDQPKVVKKVTSWVADASSQISDENSHANAKLFSSIFLQEDSTIHPESSKEQIFDQLAHVAHKVSHKRVEAHLKKRTEEKIQRHNEVFHSAATHHIYRHLVGRAALLSSPVGDADVQAALKGGIPAAPESLLFAHFLVCNATSTSQRFQKNAFDYAKTSSNAIDSFANGIQAMVKKVQSFLNLMMEYSTKRGIEELEQKIQDFIDHAMDDLEKTVDNVINQGMQQSSGEEAVALLEHGTKIKRTQDLQGVFHTVQKLLKGLTGVIPTVVDDLKFAKKEVSAVSSTLKSIFSLLGDKGTPIFDEVASLYKMIWTAYYCTFLTLSLFLMFYAFWAAGLVCAPSGEEVTHVTLEPGCIACLKRCCSRCVTCMRDCQDSHMCIWSCIILSELVVLVMFLVGIVFCILAGIKMLISTGCAQVYLLGDNETCTSILDGLRDWMATFWTDQPSQIDQACDAATLTACSVISHEMMKSAMYTVVGSFMAAILSLQLIFDTAHRHEQAHYMNKLKPRTVYDDPNQ